MPDVILPVLDEAGAIAQVLGAMPAGYRAIVVDNGSSDGSGAIAERLGATVVREPRRGFGAACHAGLLAAEGEIVCVMDCDGSFDPAELVGLVAALERGEGDLVLGRRRPSAGAWPLHARCANTILAALLRARSGLALRDLGPMRVCRRRAWLDLHVEDRAFGYPLEMVLLARRAGWQILELPVSYRPRTGRSKVTGTLRGTARAVRDMTLVLARVGARG